MEMLQDSTQAPLQSPCGLNDDLNVIFIFDTDYLSKTDGAESAPYSLNLLLAAAIFFLAHLCTDKIPDASQNAEYYSCFANLLHDLPPVYLYIIY
jgi:hypothetical protein